MARILFGPLVTSVKGSIGGVTFQSNAAGSMVRRRPQLHKSSTAKQTRAHVKMFQLLYQWQQLTQTQRDQWNMFASVYTKINKFGETKTLTGLNWFMSLNYWRNLLTLAIFTSPPVHVLPAAPPSYEMIFTDTAISINFLEPFVFTENNVAIWCSVPTRRNTITINQIRKLVTVLTATPANPLDITALWEAATGLTWNPPGIFPNANVFTCIESISATSCITSALLCTINTTPSPTDDQIYYYSQ